MEENGACVEGPLYMLMFGDISGPSSGQLWIFDTEWEQTGPWVANGKFWFM
jgi:hypothetical protein